MCPPIATLCFPFNTSFNTIKGLQSAEGYIRRELARTVNMRNTPQITFIVDQSIEYGVNISKKIDEVTRDLKDGAEE